MTMLDKSIHRLFLVLLNVYVLELVQNRHEAPLGPPAPTGRNAAGGAASGLCDGINNHEPSFCPLLHQ